MAFAGIVLAGFCVGCTGRRATPADAARRTSPTTPLTASTSTSSSTTSTTEARADGFHPITAGSALSELVTPLGTVLRIDAHALEVALVPGTAEPGGIFPEGGQVPLDRRAMLVAATNAGFKRADARGGELVDGRTVGILRPGAASFVIRGDGTFAVGAWQSPGTPGAADGVSSAPGDLVVLQNLSMLVDQGQATPDLGTDILGRWGLSFRPALPVSIWRSGVGVDSTGRLLYAAGPSLVPAQLAQLLLSGGAVRAMQLDINHLWVFATAFVHPDPNHPEAVQGQALLSGMTPTPNHVLTPGPRDFLAVYQRAPGT